MTGYLPDSWVSVLRTSSALAESTASKETFSCRKISTSFLLYVISSVIELTISYKDGKCISFCYLKLRKLDLQTGSLPVVSSSIVDS